MGPVVLMDTPIALLQHGFKKASGLGLLQL